MFAKERAPAPLEVAPADCREAVERAEEPSRFCEKTEPFISRSETA
jgi:hypothetical protein